MPLIRSYTYIWIWSVSPWKWEIYLSSVRTPWEVKDMRWPATRVSWLFAKRGHSAKTPTYFPLCSLPRRPCLGYFTVMPLSSIHSIILWWRFEYDTRKLYTFYACTTCPEFHIRAKGQGLKSNSQTNTSNSWIVLGSLYNSSVIISLDSLMAW